MCKCGCNTCDITSKNVLINENIAPKEILSEGLKHHIDNNKPLTEHLYRAGSRAYFDLFAEARSLYSRNILEIKNEDDLAILTETDLGHSGIFEGQTVPLDYIFEEEETVTIEKGSDNVIVARLGNKLIGKMVVKPYKDSYQVDTVNVYDGYKGFGIGKELYREANSEFGPLYSDSKQTREASYVWLSLIKNKEATKEGDRYKMLPAKVEEAKKKKKKKNPPLNKPKRGGSKAYYVYVRDPKTKKIKKVSFGSGGLRAKINDPKARKAFAARHKCSTKKDKTKAGYWSCRLPRYAKLLGLKSNFSGFW